MPQEKVCPGRVRKPLGIFPVCVFVCVYDQDSEYKRDYNQFSVVIRYHEKGDLQKDLFCRRCQRGKSSSRRGACQQVSNMVIRNYWETEKSYHLPPTYSRESSEL